MVQSIINKFVAIVIVVKSTNHPDKLVFLNNNNRSYEFVNDGVYRVIEFQKEKREFDKLVYKFSLEKIYIRKK